MDHLFWYSIGLSPSSRTQISIALGGQRYSFGQDRWPTWNVSARTSCRARASSFRGTFAAGCRGGATLGSVQPPSASRLWSGDSSLGGELVTFMSSLSQLLTVSRVAEHLRQTRAAVRLQTCFRCFVQRRRYQRLRKLTVFLQTCYRGQRARQELTRRRREAKAKVIQRNVRGWLARVAFRSALRQVTLVQCSVRRWMAKRELRRLKEEARSVNHLKNLNRGLELKIIELQMKLTDKVR